MSLLNEPTREEWCRHHKPGRLSAVFHAGETLRCPMWRTQANGKGRVCGGDLGRTPDDVRDAIVRGPLGLPPIQGSEHQHRTCMTCRRTVDVFFVRAQELEATG